MLSWILENVGAQWFAIFAKLSSEDAEWMPAVVGVNKLDQIDCGRWIDEAFADAVPVIEEKQPEENIDEMYKSELGDGKHSAKPVSGSAGAAPTPLPRADGAGGY